MISTGGQGTSVLSTPTRYGEEGWHEGTTKTTIRAENEVEAQREANNYKVGFPPLHLISILFYRIERKA